jgi:hypothetical protein
MLFDLRARGRRTTIKVIYVFLALLMGGGLIFFGIGGATSGGLLDAFKSNGGGSSAQKLAQKKVDTAQKSVQLRHEDPAAWAALTKAFYQKAGVESSTDANNNTVYTNDGKKDLAQAAQSWNRYLTLAGDKADVSLAQQMTGVFAQLNKPTQAVQAIEVVINHQPTYGNYYQYATLAYAAGQTRKGDLAAAKAVALAPKDQRKDVETQLKAMKAQPAATQSTTTG